MDLRNSAAGFTLVEALVAAAIIGVLAAVAGPIVGSSMRLYALNTSAQTVASVVRDARYTAVSKNRTVRVRFNCPSANQLRIVELLNSAADTAGDRCSETAYPYPDTDTSSAPDVDGPVMTLPSEAEFDTVGDLQIDTSGRVTPLVGCPACATGAGDATIVVTNGDQTQTITVSMNGQVRID